MTVITRSKSKTKTARTLRISISAALFFLIISAKSIVAGGSVPEWAKGAVWYQIIPDRFRNLNPYNDPIKKRVVGEEWEDWQIHPWASDFYKLQIWEEKRQVDFDKLLTKRRYGGDLLGIIEKLDYLEDLGVNVLLLSPIFESPSVLKYDASTFHHIDDNFGTKRKEDSEKIRSEKEDRDSWTWASSDETFLNLLRQAHEREMKVVIEAQFVYCNREFWAFRDLEEQQQNSAYKDWFEVFSWDDPATPDTVEFRYQAWEDNPDWPLFKQDENGLVEPVKTYVFNVTRRWMAPVREEESVDGIDGWYVNNSLGDIHPKFWKEWLQYVKSLNPEAVTVAEYPLTRSGTNGAIDFDISVNHELGDLIESFFIEQDLDGTVAEFSERLEKLRTARPKSQNESFVTRLGNQNTARLATRIKSAHDDCAFTNHAESRCRLDPQKPSKEDYQTQKLIALFTLTYPGSPMIFYGDESGMWGGKMPHNLKPMLWRELFYEDETYRTIDPSVKAQVQTAVEPDLLKSYRKVNQIRAEHPALRTGTFEHIHLDNADTVFAFRRTAGEDDVVVLINTGDEEITITPTLPWEYGTKVRDLLTDAKFRIKTSGTELTLPKKWGALLVKD